MPIGELPEASCPEAIVNGPLTWPFLPMEARCLHSTRRPPCRPCLGRWILSPHALVYAFRVNREALLGALLHQWCCSLLPFTWTTAERATIFRTWASTRNTERRR